MTIDEALNYGRKKLISSPSPALDARLLLEHILNQENSYLVAHGDESLSIDIERCYRRLINRAVQKEPIPYILGQANFFELEFIVSQSVLIPRPETELLVQQAIKWAKNRNGRSEQKFHIVDVGTGSGCVAITLAKHFPDARIEAIDVSEDALMIAQKNAKKHAVEENIEFHQGRLLEPIDSILDLIIANLPYISDNEWTELDDGVKLYEPAIALRGGHDGLDLIRQLLLQARSRLAPNGGIFLEIGWRQGLSVCEIARSHFPFAKIDSIKDYAGHDRIMTLSTPRELPSAS